MTAVTTYSRESRTLQYRAGGYRGTPRPSAFYELAGQNLPGEMTSTGRSDQPQQGGASGFGIPLIP
jgi:hypothetical protein